MMKRLAIIDILILMCWDNETIWVAERVFDKNGIEVVSALYKLPLLVTHHNYSLPYFNALQSSLKQFHLKKGIFQVQKILKSV